MNILEALEDAKIQIKAQELIDNLERSADPSEIPLTTLPMSAQVDQMPATVQPTISPVPTGQVGTGAEGVVPTTTTAPSASRRPSASERLQQSLANLGNIAIMHESAQVDASMNLWNKATDTWREMVSGYQTGLEVMGEAEEINNRAVAMMPEVMLETISWLAKPTDAASTGLYHAVGIARTSVSVMHPLRTTKTLFRLKTLTDIPKDIGQVEQAIRDGWNGENVKRWDDVAKIGTLGPEAMVKWDQWADSVPGLKQAKTVSEFVFNLSIDMAIDIALWKGLGAPGLKSLAKRSDVAARTLAHVAPKTFTKIFWDEMILPPKIATSKGFLPWWREAVKVNSGLEFDNFLQESLLRKLGAKEGVLLGEGFERVALSKRFAAAPGLAKEGAEFSAKVGALKGEIATNHKRFLFHEHRLRTRTLPLIAEAEIAMGKLDNQLFLMVNQTAKANRRILRKLNTTYNRLDDLYRSKDFSTGQLANRKKEADRLVGRLRHVMADLSDTTRIDSYARKLQIDRAIRTKFIDEWMGAGPAVTAGRRADVKKITNAVSNGRTKLVEELSRDEFGAMFDYLDALVTPSSAFAFRKSVKPVIFGKELKKSRRVVPPFYNTNTPAWAFFRRKNAEMIPKIADVTDAKSMSHTTEVLEGWNYYLRQVGGAKNEDAMARIFHWANGDNLIDKIPSRDKAFMLSKKAKLKAPQIRIEQEAGEFINRTFDEIKDEFINQGRWPEDLVIKKTYIKNIVEKSMDDAVNDSQLAGEIISYIKRTAKTDIDINEWINRVKSHDYPVLTDANTAVKLGLHSQIKKLYWEPTLKRIETFAAMTGDPDLIQYTDNWINYAIRGAVTEREAKWTPLFAKLAQTIEKKTAFLPEKYQFIASDRPVKQISRGVRRFVYAMTMPFNLSPVAKNITQSINIIPLTSYKSYNWGIKSLFTDGGKRLAEHSRLLPGRNPMESLDLIGLSKLEQKGYKWFRAVDKWPNVKGSFNTAAHHLVSNDKEAMEVVRKYGKFGSTRGDANGFANAIANAFDDGKLMAIQDQVHFMSKTAQYGYRAGDMPQYMWDPFMKMFTQFTTWPANYFYSYLPDIFEATLTGKAPWGTLGWWERQMMLRHYVNQTSLLIAGKAMGVDMSRHMPPTLTAEFPFVHPGGAAPTGLPPVGQLGLSLVKLGFAISSKNERGKAEAINELKRLPLYPLGPKKALDVLRGKKPLATLGFRLIKNETSGGSGQSKKIWSE